MVRLYVLRGHDLMPLDSGMVMGMKTGSGKEGYSDPYIRCKLGKEEFNNRDNYLEDVVEVGTRLRPREPFPQRAPHSFPCPHAHMPRPIPTCPDPCHMPRPISACRPTSTPCLSSTRACLVRASCRLRSGTTIEVPAPLSLRLVCTLTGAS